MNQIQMEKLLEKCDQICIWLGGLGYRLNENMGPFMKPKFRYELLKYSVYLADADGLIDTGEVVHIRQLLGVRSEVQDLKTLKKTERIPYGYRMDLPESLRCAVRADTEIISSMHPYHNQAAQLLLDVYKVLGQTFLALYEREPSNEASMAYTLYIQNLEAYLKESNVFYKSDKKFYQIEELEQLQEEGSQACEKQLEEVTEEVIAADERHSLFPKKKEKERTLEEKLEDLNAMIGLDSVKREVNALVNLIRIQKLRELNGIGNVETTKHMVFSGNPGTGKTTIARILAEIYKDLGVLEKGTLVEVDRSGLVKGFMGQTALKVKEVVKSAMGGILFIDEAYTLTVDKGPGDYGQEAVDTILKEMEDHRDDLIVIVAGYTDLMEQFLDSNPGLRSRFNKFILFEDYTAQQEYEILLDMAKKQEYQLTEMAQLYVKTYFEQLLLHKPDNFANAREARNLLEKAIFNQASRLVQIASPDREMLQTLEAVDFEPGGLKA